MTTSRGQDYDQYNSCVNPKWLIIKMVAQKGCSDRANRSCFHITQVKFEVLVSEPYSVHSYAEYDMFYASNQGITQTSLTYLPLWEQASNYFKGNEIMKQLAFLVVSSTPSLRIYCTNSSHLFLGAKYAYFHHFPFSPLNTLHIVSFLQKIT